MSYLKWITCERFLNSANFVLLRIEKFTFFACNEHWLFLRYAFLSSVR